MSIPKKILINISAALLVLFLMFPSVSLSANVSPERISIAYPTDSVPFYFSDETGQPAGIIIDMWRLWSEKTGIKIDFKAAAWDETLKMVGSGAADVHAGLFFNSERDQFLDFGAALTKTDTHYFTHMALPQIKEVGDLAPYRVGVLAGDYVERYLKERLSEGNVISFPDNVAVMNALQKGTLRVFAADTPTALYHLEKSGQLSDFTFISEKPLYQNDFFFAVQEGNQPLIEVINQGMSLITDDEKRDINRRWVTYDDTEDKALIVSIDREYPPLTFINAMGDASGLFVDMWQAWARETGQTIQFRATGWVETLEGLRTGEVDIHSGLSFSQKRQEWIDFSTQIYESHTRIYHRADDIQPVEIDDYGTSFIGTEFNTHQETEFRKEYPDLRSRSYGSTQELIDALLEGEIKAFLQEDLFMEAVLDRLGLRGDIISRPEILFPSTIHAGVQKGNTDLLKLINHGFAALSDEKLEAIESRWVNDSTLHYYGSDEKEISFDEDEESWLEEHPFIDFAVSNFLAPVDIVDDKGRYSGFNADLIKLLNKKLSINIVPVFFNKWDELVNSAVSGKVHGAFSFSRTPEREKQMLFTQPYAYDPIITVVRRDDNRITRQEDIQSKRVSVVKGLAVKEQVLNDVGETGKIFEFDSEIDALNALVAGDVDAHISSLIMFGNSQKKLFIPELRIAVSQNFEGGALRVAIHKNNPQLFSIVRKGLDSITRTELAELREQWLSPDIKTKKGKQIPVNEKEAGWLANNRKIRLGIDPSWAPFEFVDQDGIYSGISSSYVDAAEERLQVEMQPMQGFTWSQVIEKVQAKDVDVLPAVVRSSDREKYLNFTKPYISLPVIIAVHRGLPYFGSLEDLSGYRIGVVTDYFTDESIKKDYPDLKLSRFSTLKEGLTALDEGKLDAFVDTLDAITYEMTLSGFSNIKISAPTEYKCELAFGVRKDWPELVGLLNKVITDISEKERTLIKNTWMAPVELKYGIDLKRILIWAVPIGASIVLIILFGFIWNRRLSVEVSERKKKEELIILGAKISQSLTLSETLRETLQNITDIFVKELNVVFARIWVVNETDDVLKLQASSGLYDHIEGDHERLPLEGDTKISRVVFEKKPHLSNNILESPYIKDKDWAREQGLKSFAGIPMIVDNRSVGAMVVFSRETIPEDTYRTILSISDSIAVAIERKRAEQEALASERKIRAMSESSLDALIMIDGKASIIFWNPASERIFGYSSEEAIGQNLHELIVAPDARELAHKGISTFTKTGEGNVIGVVIEHKALRKDGSTFPAEIAVSALQMENEWYAVGTVRDITDRKQSEVELKQHLKDLEQFERLVVGREERMIELKEEINGLLQGMEKANKYKIV